MGEEKRGGTAPWLHSPQGETQGSLLLLLGPHCCVWRLILTTFALTFWNGQADGQSQHFCDGYSLFSTCLIFYLQIIPGPLNRFNYYWLLYEFHIFSSQVSRAGRHPNYLPDFTDRYFRGVEPSGPGVFLSVSAFHAAVTFVIFYAVYRVPKPS